MGSQQSATRLSEKTYSDTLQIIEKLGIGALTSQILPWTQYQNPVKIQQQQRTLDVNIPDEHKLKLFSKILGNWIQSHIKNFIHHDQIGFVPEVQEWFYIHKLLN